MTWSAGMGVDLLNVRGLQELDLQAPVVMVNLMRFRERSLDGDGSGWDAYLRYSALTVPMIKARGGTLLWTGDAKAVALGAEDGNQWDYLALVYYPTVAAFIDMMTSEDYETALRSPPHQRLRRARDHRDQGGLQQVQGGVDRSPALRAKRSNPTSVRLTRRDLDYFAALAITWLTTFALKTSCTRSGVISLMERMPSSARSRSISACSSVIARCTPASPPAIAA